MGNVIPKTYSPDFIPTIDPDPFGTARTAGDGERQSHFGSQRNTSSPSR